MKPVYFISDLDGTLLGKGGKVSQRDLESIKGRPNHMHFCIATGRHIGEVVEDLALHNHARYIITCNGNEIYEVNNGQPSCIYEGPIISSDILEAVMNIATKYKAYRVLATSRRYVCENKGLLLRLIEMMHGLKHEHVSSLKEYLTTTSERPLKLLFIFTNKQGVALRRELEQTLGDKVDVTMSNGHCVEVNMKGVSKGAAIHFLKDHVGEDALYACVGDNDNDLSMVDVCQYSFAMESGLEQLKAGATETVSSVGHALARMKELHGVREK